MGEIRVGVSGWRYAGWRGSFYPAGLRQRDELAYLAGQLRTVEINGTFYSLQRPARFQSWCEAAPDDFVFTVKGGRFLTHMRKLRDVRVPLANFFASGLSRLGRKLGPILWQFPATMAYDADRFEAFLALLPRTPEAAAALAAEHRLAFPAEAGTFAGVSRLRYAFEVRHASFFTGDFAARLRRWGDALVVADSGGAFPTAEEVTADFMYARLHGPAQLYAGRYGDAALDAWAAKATAWSARGDVFVFFDNDQKAEAPRDALRLAARLAKD